MNKISLGLLAAGALLALTAWQGWSQQQWINQQNRAIAISTASTPRQHNSPLWPLLGIGGLTSLAMGAIGLRNSGLPEPPTGAAKPLPAMGFNGVPVAQSGGGDRVAQIHPITMGKNHNSISTNWLDKFLNSHCHLAINGVTNSGKTTLAEHALSIWNPSEVWVIDPKYNAVDPSWSYIPRCADIESVMESLSQLEKRLRARQQNEEPHTDLAVVIDELDWIALTYKSKAIDSIRKLYKVGRSLGFRVLLCGQSPYAKTLDGSDWKNFNRVILGNEAVAFCSNPQFPYEKEKYYQKCLDLHQDKKRFGLWIPVSGDPFVREVPVINPPVQARFSETDDSSPEPSEPSSHKWLNQLLDKEHSDFEPAEPWQPRDPLAPSEPSPESIGKAIELHRFSYSQTKIIEVVWGAKKGGNQAYQVARQHLQTIMQNLGVN
ncbi:hypothetical protein PMG71_09560 [Roseofilum sp. BLCC_M154]|uniref:AAA+ ATPase domain-containing protein n=1 Tax=Roseofilum acuticapitatum BLCC-M154 TaxID=3022444 RepID=A0ABT7ASW7_9CYAN|nr:hypothetical protein [Roseofilum acuticapitatum]MDJ1169672.1 hypothetical protein [Roseofilum acuticapitatum BLCC-M154]